MNAIGRALLLGAVAGGVCTTGSAAWPLLPQEGASARVGDRGVPVPPGPVAMRFDDALFAGAELSYAEEGGSYRVTVGNPAFLAPENAVPEIVSVQIAPVFTLFGALEDPSDDLSVEGAPMVFLPGEAIYLPLQPSEAQAFDAVFVKLRVQDTRGVWEYPPLGVLPGGARELGDIRLGGTGFGSGHAPASSPPAAGAASPAPAGRKEHYDGGKVQGSFIEFECPRGATRDKEGEQPGCELEMTNANGQTFTVTIPPDGHNLVSAFVVSTAHSSYWSH